jgi:hypothetical protein
MTKTSYTKAKNKKATREFIFSHYKQPKIVGLAGPDINEYVDWCKSSGFEVEEIWEKDPRVMMKQLTDIKHDSAMKYRFGNINDTTPNKNDVVYDLDYCGCVKTLYDSVVKFKQNIVMTFALRGVGAEKTIVSFFSKRNEKILTRTNKSKPVNHISIKTNQGVYIVVPYFDTTPMLTIARIS